MNESENITARPEVVRETAKRQFAEARNVFDSHVQSIQLMCRISEKYAGPDDDHHNCLGCNLNDLTQQVSKYLSVAALNTVDFDVHHQFSIYAFLLNTCWERIRDVFKILNISDDYRSRHFAPFARLRRWANFFKHPKVFGWVIHHPRYSIENSDDHNQLRAEAKKYLFINDDFLKKHYSHRAPDEDKKLRFEFDGFKRSTVVLMPDVAQLTREICSCLNHFVEIITENPNYVEMLSDTSTIQNFYEYRNEQDDLDCREEFVR